MELDEVKYYQNVFKKYISEEEESMNDVIVKSGILEFDSESEVEDDESSIEVLSNDDGLSVSIKEEPFDDFIDENVPGTSNDSFKRETFETSQSESELNDESSTKSHDNRDDEPTPDVVIKEEIKYGASDNEKSQVTSDTERDYVNIKIKEEVIDIDPVLEIKQEPINREDDSTANCNTRLTECVQDAAEFPRREKEIPKLSLGQILRRRLEGGLVIKDKIKGHSVLRMRPDGTKKNLTRSSNKFAFPYSLDLNREKTTADFHFKIGCVVFNDVHVHFVCSKCGEILVDYVQVLSHPCLKRKRPKLECLYCQHFTVEDVNQIDGHFAGVADAFRLNRRIDSYRCLVPTCLFVTPSDPCMALHFKRHHRGESGRFKTLMNGEMIDCPMCQNKYTYETALRRHMDLCHKPVRREQDYKFSCPCCDYKAVFRSSLKIHFNFAHGKTK